MAKTDFQTVDEYLATFPESTQQALRQVRTAIREAVPEAEERISYQMPAYKYHGWLVYFSGFTNHYSVFAIHSDALVEAFGDELAGRKIATGTIQFPLDQPVPVDLIRRMVRYRADALREAANETGGGRRRSAARPG